MMTEDQLYLAIWGAAFAAADRLAAAGMADRIDRQAAISETIRQAKEAAAAPIRDHEAGLNDPDDDNPDDPDSYIDPGLLGVVLDPGLRDETLAADVAALIAAFAVDTPALIRALVTAARAAVDIAGGLDAELAARADAAAEGGQ